MRIQLIYFTGTGNTKFITELISEQFKTNDIELIPIESLSEDINIIDPNAVLGLGYPVYDLMPPRNVMKALDEIKTVKNQHAFVFSTYTSYPLDSNYHAAQILQSKGYNVISMTDFKAPGASSFLYSNPDNFIVKGKTIFEKGLKAHITEFVSDITVKSLLPSQPVTIKFNRFNKIHQSFSNKFFGFLFYKNLRVNDNCNQCGLCIKSCPEGNLSVDDTLKISKPNECLKCLRCVQICPQKAINFTSAKRRGDYTTRQIEMAYDKL